MPKPLSARSLDQIRSHYEIEKQLAAKLRQAGSQSERLDLYHKVYDERLRLIPAHPLLTQAQDPVAQERGAAPQIRLILPFLKPGMVFMELGPGDCAVAFAVARRASRVYAVDVSDGLIQNVDRPKNFEFIFSDGISVPVPPGRVNLAYSNQLMEHLHPDDALDQLRNIYTALAPGGAYLCVTPNRLSGPWDISRGFDEVATGLHLREYAVGELARQFRAAGFSRVRAIVSYHGRRLLPNLPIWPVELVERGIERLPRQIQRRLAAILTAVKVMGYK